MSSKPHSPRYAPRERYRTRPSTREVGPSSGDLDATALDRPVFSPSDLATLRARAAPRPSPAQRRSASRCALARPCSLLPLAAAVIGSATVAGAVFGAALALL